MELTTEKNATGATEVSGVGTVARTGWMSHTAELRTTSGATCEAKVSGLMQWHAAARDGHGTALGTWDRNGMRNHSGAVQWQGKSYELRVESQMSGRYSLMLADRVMIAVKRKGLLSAQLTLEVEDEVDPLLILFVVWLAQTFQRMNRAAAAG
ncbi:MAG: hypothetical protein V9G04_12450 [Nocardioides sp.]